jgi:hypothetical protein
MVIMGKWGDQEFMQTSKLTYYQGFSLDSQFRFDEEQDWLRSDAVIPFMDSLLSNQLHRLFCG